MLNARGAFSRLLYCQNTVFSSLNPIIVIHLVYNTHTTHYTRLYALRRRDVRGVYCCKAVRRSEYANALASRLSRAAPSSRSPLEAPHSRTHRTHHGCRFTLCSVCPRYDTDAHKVRLYSLSQGLRRCAVHAHGHAACTHTASGQLATAPSRGHVASCIASAHHNNTRNTQQQSTAECERPQTVLQVTRLSPPWQPPANR